MDRRRDARCGDPDPDQRARFRYSAHGETAPIRPSHPSRNGRARYLLIGDWNGERVVAVVVSPLGTEALSWVSLRSASPVERSAYDRYRAET